MFNRFYSQIVDMMDHSMHGDHGSHMNAMDHTGHDDHGGHGGHEGHGGHGDSGGHGGMEHMMMMVVRNILRMALLWRKSEKFDQFHSKYPRLLRKFFFFSHFDTSSSILDIKNKSYSTNGVSIRWAV